MNNKGPRITSESFSQRQPKLYFLILTIIAMLSLTKAQAQENSSSVPACLLRKDVYTCDGATFQKLLANTQNISLDTHTIDKVAQSQLRDFITKKLHKTVVPEGSPCDLVFLLFPLEATGVNYTSGDAELGTLRIYLPNPQNTRGEIVWAEVFYGRVELPWPSVVNGLIDQFRGHFHIK